MLKIGVDVGLGDLRVLIVDDQPDMLRLLRGVLMSFGVAGVEEARDGEEALFLLRSRHPNFIITDWEMEPMDGYTFVFHVRDLRHGPDATVPIIMMSAHAEPTRITAARKLGVAQFVLKPIVPNHLLQRMTWVLEHPIRYVQQDEHFVPDGF